MPNLLDLAFHNTYRVENSSDFPDPVTDHDISLLEQMGAEILIDKVHRTVYILNGKRRRRRNKRPDTGRRVVY